MTEYMVGRIKRDVVASAIREDDDGNISREGNHLKARFCRGRCGCSCEVLRQCVPTLRICINAFVNIEQTAPDRESCTSHDVKSISHRFSPPTFDEWDTIREHLNLHRTIRLESLLDGRWKWIERSR